MVDLSAAAGGRLSGEALARALALAAAPAFALMALWTEVWGQPNALCSATTGGMSPMTPMYLMMSAAHLAPWIRLIGAQPR